MQELILAIIGTVLFAIPLIMIITLCNKTRKELNDSFEREKRLWEEYHELGREIRKEKRMKELMFRAWDSERKTYDHEELLLAPNGEILASRWRELCEPESKYIIEPYTGLKDKNGKEIYEGDILASNYSTVYKVSYSEPNGRFEMWSEDGCGGSIADDQYTEDFEIEVIGNIHENHELLEQDNAKD